MFGSHYPLPLPFQQPCLERVCNCDECWGIPSGCNFDWLRLVSRLQMCDRKVIDGSRMFILRKTDWMKYLFGHLWAKSKMKILFLWFSSQNKHLIWVSANYAFLCESDRFLKIKWRASFWNNRIVKSIWQLLQSHNIPWGFFVLGDFPKFLDLYLAYFIEFRFRSLNIYTYFHLVLVYSLWWIVCPFLQLSLY